MSVRAAIDCGSNSTRLLIVGDDGTVLSRELRTTRLGQGMGDARLLSNDAIGRTIDAVAEYKVLLEMFNVTRLRIAATSAARDAINGSDLVQAVERVVGQPLEILTGEQEALTSYKGAITDQDGPCLVIDIGGGSTELAVGIGPTLVKARSVNLGCVRLTDQFFSQSPYSNEDMVAAFDFMLPVWPDPQKEFVVPENSMIVGVAGTITTLAALELGLTSYVPGAVDGFVLTQRAVIDRFAGLAAMTLDEVRKVPGMPPDRAGIIGAGSAILGSLMRRFEIPELRVSEADILDGLLP